MCLFCKELWEFVDLRFVFCMRKVRISKVKNRKGYYVFWRENGQRKARQRKAKQCNTKGEAEHFAHMKYMEINSDVYDLIDKGWDELVIEYLRSYDIRGLSQSSKYEAKRFLLTFKKNCSPKTSKSVNQNMCDWHILQRQNQGVSRFTVNKDIGRLRAFIAWMKKRGYNNSKIELTMLKTSKPEVKALTTEQIQKLFRDCPTKAWRARILLSLVTGLRKTDIENIPNGIIDLKAMKFDSKSLKTGKVYNNRPIPKDAIPELAEYVESLPEGQVMLFEDRNVRKEFDKFRNGITRQDFRKTFSTYMQTIGSIGSAQNLLEHYSPETTKEFYTDQELVLRWKINQLPVKEWLS